MIDVIFAILAFLIMSTLFLTRSEGLPVSVPEATNSSPQPQQQLVVTIAPDGNIALNRQAIRLDALVDEVEQRMNANQNPLVIINADTAVSHGEVVTIMDRLRDIEGVRLAIATQQP
jgi:biopolymer transport protein ExbD